MYAGMSISEWNDLTHPDCRFLVIAVNKMLSVGALLSSSEVVNNVVYVGSTDGFLYALM
jgi:hypothetical protein